MLTLIVNPVAGHGLATTVHKRVCQFLTERGIAHQSYITAKPGDAEMQSRHLACEGAEAVAILGGDGTIYEAVNGLARSDVVCYFVPCGTGNDFIKALNLPSDPIAAFSAQLEAPLSRIDLGRMNHRIFANVSGAGFDVEVLRQTDRFKSLSHGLLPYLFGVVAAVKRFTPLRALIKIDGDIERDMRLTVISIGNGQYIGGGMKAVPDALISDGLFDVITVEALKKKRYILKLLPRFINGTHVSLPIAHTYRCKRLRIDCENMVLNLDGELIPCDNAEFELLAGALRVRRPIVPLVALKK